MLVTGGHRGTVVVHAGTRHPLSSRHCHLQLTHCTLLASAGSGRAGWIASSTRGSGPSISYTYHLHYAPLQGIGSGQRQLIVVTCIAEHA